MKMNVFTSWRYISSTAPWMRSATFKIAENEKRRLLTDLLNGKSVLETQICSVVEGPWRLRLRAEWVNPQGTRAQAGDSDHDAFQPPDESYKQPTGWTASPAPPEPRQ
jgi:hypothetical protein